MWKSRLIDEVLGITHFNWGYWDKWGEQTEGVLDDEIKRGMIDDEKQRSTPTMKTDSLIGCLPLGLK